MGTFWHITIVEFLLDLAVFSAVVVAYGLVLTLTVRPRPASPLTRSAAIGVLFGAATALVVLMPIHMSGGGFTGTRPILLALSGLLAGPVAALAATPIAIVTGLIPSQTGSVLVAPGIVMALASVGAGLALRLLLDRRKNAKPGEISYYHLPLLGALSVSLNLLALWAFRGSEALRDAVEPAYICGISAATILGTLLLRETHRHKAEEELREREAHLALQAEELLKSRDAAYRANRAKSEFLANMSHELRTPLNAIIGFSEILNKQLFGPLENEKYREYIKDINDSGTHLLDIINDILDLAKAEAGRLEPQISEYDLARCLEDCIRMSRGRAESGDVRLALEGIGRNCFPRVRLRRSTFVFPGRS